MQRSNNEQSNRTPRCSREVSAAGLPWIEHLSSVLYIGEMFVRRL